MHTFPEPVGLLSISTINGLINFWQSSISRVILYIYTCIGYSTIETKEVDVLDIRGFIFRMSTQVWYNGFLFPHEYSGEVFAWVLRYFTWVLMRKQKPVTGEVPEYSCGKRNPLYPIRANSFVSIIMYLTFTIIVLLKK